MDKQAKYQDKILKFLPKAALNLPFSPNKEKRFSGPIVPMIPHEARVRRRRRSPRKNSFDDHHDGGDDDVSIMNDEPTSPKISCMGQIKQKSKSKSFNKKINGSFNTNNKKISHSNKKDSDNTNNNNNNNNKPATWSPREVKKQASKIKRMFSTVIVKHGRKSSASVSSPNSVDHDHGDRDHDLLPDRAPSLSQMKRFASGRDHRLSGFDWAAAVQITPVDAPHRNINDSEGDESDDVIIPFSAPLGIRNYGNDDSDNQVPLQPRKEINLWKRRTMAPPRPLVLKTMMIRAN